jgi:hypothetical protein
VRYGKESKIKAQETEIKITTKYINFVIKGTLKY